MYKIKDIKKRYADETSNLMQYVIHSMVAFGYNKYVKIDGVSDDEIIFQSMQNYENNFVDAVTEDKNRKIIEKIRKKISRELNQHHKFLEQNEKKEVPEKLLRLEIISDDLGLVNYLSREHFDGSFDEFWDDFTSKTAESIKQDIDSIPGGEKYYGKFTVHDYEELLEYCRIIFYNEHLDDIYQRSVELNDYRMALNLMDYQNSICIFRQTFILLMTAFDAAIFDLAEIIIRNHFFEFCKANEDSLVDNYKLKEIVNTGSFEKFKDEVITKILEKNYASGLLKMMYRYNKNYFIINSKDEYKTVCEILARRNIHVHKRGIVDQGYFEQSQENRYNLKCNDVAYIRSEYYLNTTTLLLCLVNNVCDIES